MTRFIEEGLEKIRISSFCEIMSSFSWSKLVKSKEGANVAPSSQQSCTAVSCGFVVFGGIDGRKNEHGVPIPNSDLNVITLRNGIFFCSAETSLFR
jgi:hypothetical protein